MTKAEKTGLEQIVERVVTQVLESHTPQLRKDLVGRVVEQLPSELQAGAPPAAAPESSAADLLKAISAIHAGATQREILRALLDNTVRYSGRAALFVVKAGAAVGWQGRAFANNEGIKDFVLDVSMGVAGRAMQSRMAMAGRVAEVDSKFVFQFGAPADDHVVLLPLLLKEKVAALVYVDAGVEPGGNIDAAAMEMLVMAASAWLEVASSRKQTQKEGAAETAERGAAAAQAVSAHVDPFATHAPKHAAAAASSAGQPVSAAAEPVSTSGAGAAPAAAPDEFAQMPPEEADVHRKAQRFARLLVDEIKLYNQAKVTEGRKHKDLYDRLKDEIEKSRATFKKRYGNTAAGSADHFSNELIRSLAEDDSSLLGANFRR